MKKLLLIVLSVMLIFGCSEQASDPEDNPVPAVESVKISKVLIGTADNMIIQVPIHLQNSSISTASIEDESGLKTVTIDGLINIEIEGGLGKIPIKGYSIKGSNLIKAAVSFRDSSGDITTCIVDQNDNCTEIALNPQKLSKFGNSDYFREESGELYFRTVGKKLRTMNSIGAITDIAEDVEQLEFDTNGGIMYESSSDIILMKNDGTQISMDGSFWDGRNQLRLDALSKKFLIGRQDQGFTFYTQENYFGNLFFDSNGDPVASHAQPIAWDLYVNQGQNGVYFAVNTNQSPLNCSKHIVDLKDVVICGNEIFIMGDDVTDLSEINLNYSLHSIFNLQIVASESALYMYSENADGTPRKLSKENIFELISSSISENYKIDTGGLTVTQNNTINFCGSRNGTDYIVQIINADTIPIITETPGTCDSIVSIQ